MHCRKRSRLLGAWPRQCQRLAMRAMNDRCQPRQRLHRGMLWRWRAAMGRPRRQRPPRPFAPCRRFRATERRQHRRRHANSAVLRLTYAAAKRRGQCAPRHRLLNLPIAQCKRRVHSFPSPQFARAAAFSPPAAEAAMHRRRECGRRGEFASARAQKAKKRRRGSRHSPPSSEGQPPGAVAKPTAGCGGRFVCQRNHRSVAVTACERRAVDGDGRRRASKALAPAGEFTLCAKFCPQRHRQRAQAAGTVSLASRRGEWALIARGGARNAARARHENSDRPMPTASRRNS